MRAKLTEVADTTLFSHQKFADDPCVMWYRFKTGDKLAKVERTNRLHVPTQILLKINHVADARTIQARQTLKLLRGPFHAVISKSGFTMDVPSYTTVDLSASYQFENGLKLTAGGRNILKADFPFSASTWVGETGETGGETDVNLGRGNRGKPGRTKLTY